MQTSPYSSQTSILNKSSLSLQRAKQHLTGLQSVMRTKPISPLSQITTSFKTKNMNPKKRTKTFSNDIQIGLISELNNEIIINNRNITGSNVELSNRLSSLLEIQNYNGQNSINQKINELTSYCDYLEDMLRENNDTNTGILNSYEELNIKMKDAVNSNKKIINEVQNLDEMNLELQQTNDELKRNLNEISKRFQNESQILVNYFNNCKKDYNDSLEKNSFLKDLNKNLQKSNKDYNEIIIKMKETINILTTKKNSESLDLKEIERRLNERDKEIEKRDFRLNELKDINDKLVKEGTNIQEEINQVFDQLSNHNQLGNQLTSIKETINKYDNQIEQLKNIIRKKDREIEAIKSNYGDLNKKLKKRKIEDNSIPKSRNEINNKLIESGNYENFDNRNNILNDNNIYNITESNEKSNNDLNIIETNNYNNNIEDTKSPLNNIYDEEIKKIKDSNAEIDINERKNHAKRLLEENRKLQQEYLDLIGQGMNNKKKENIFENLNDENIKEMNRILSMGSNLVPIEEEQKEDKGEESINENNSPINLPLQMVMNSEESENNYDMNN
jgi:DNA repair exonuclease SbcCD ATPase subunit